ncbi:DUF819 family protein [Aeoliella mucimassa]|uniref:DUF819 family protein n=1 Tax=Aeoliella mucimassa TaxID=2527972 RepID=A0A518AR59_9BACT|nr:DUF819 family protein [Aeoliella mucimassa]QDU57213.1 hypothetical protein Pan181_34270 [Aeoliella mucimassa]
MFNTPLIHPDNTWALWAVIVTGTALAIWLEQTYRWAAKISGPFIALLLAMLLSNTGVMPTEAKAYGVVSDYLVPLAIPLLLLRANVFRIAKETGPMFMAFHLSVLGTMLGAVFATMVLHNQVEQVSETAGIMTASYTGGAVNFFAVREAFTLSENLVSPLLVADNFIMAGVFLLLLAIGGNATMKRWYGLSEEATSDDSSDGTSASVHWKPQPISLLDLAKSFAISLCVVAVASTLGGWIRGTFPDSLLGTVLGNDFVLITFLSVILATLFRRSLEKINGANELGTLMLYIFLFAIGLPADLLAVLGNVPMLFVFCLIIAVTNLLVTLILGRLLHLDLRELLVCVSATLGGPPTAVAIAITQGWKHLIVPATLVGIWGYVIGTFLGVFIGETLLRVLG